MNKRIKRKVIFLLLLIVFVVFFCFLVFILGRPVTKDYLRTMANQIIKTCKSDSHPTSCYDREIPKLMNKISMEQAFEVTKYIQETDETYLFCHVLAHKLSSIEAKKKNADWRDVLTRCPVTMCNNGCPHGVLMARFSGESLDEDQIKEIIPDVSMICEPRQGWSPTEVERSMCYHAIGHLAMYVTAGDPQRALDFCAVVSMKGDGRDYYQTCAQGVFMSVFQPLEPDDIALVKDIVPQKSEVPRFCGKYKAKSDDYFACMSESWPLFFDEISKPGGLTKFCSFTNDEWGKNWCYGTGFTIMTTNLIAEDGVRKITDYCVDMIVERQGQCFANMASRLVQIDPRYTQKAVEVCMFAQKIGQSEHCFSDLLFYSKYSFVIGSEEHRKYCLFFPSGYSDKCLSGDVPTDFFGNL